MSTLAAPNGLECTAKLPIDQLTVLKYGPNDTDLADGNHYILEMRISEDKLSILSEAHVARVFSRPGCFKKRTWDAFAMIPEGSKRSKVG